MAEAEQGRPTSTGAEDVHPGHGNSVAAWTAVCLVVLASLVMAVAIVAGPLWWLFVVGCVLVVLGGIAGKVLAAMGFGVSGKPGH
jgi:hypothetical protein